MKHREIKGSGPSGPHTAFRGERLQPGSAGRPSCFQAPVLPWEQSHFCLQSPQRQGRAGSRKSLIGVVNERPCELPVPPAGWGMLVFSSWPAMGGLASRDSRLGPAGLVPAPLALGPKPCSCLFVDLSGDQPYGHSREPCRYQGVSVRLPFT